MGVEALDRVREARRNQDSEMRNEADGKMLDNGSRR